MALTHSDSKEHTFDDSKNWKFRLAGACLLLKSRTFFSLKVKGTLNFPTISAFLRGTFSFVFTPSHMFYHIVAMCGVRVQ
jgi:hypothetical protein